MFERIVYGAVGVISLTTAALHIHLGIARGQEIEAWTAATPILLIGLLYWAEALLPRRMFKHPEALVAAVVLHIGAATMMLGSGLMTMSSAAEHDLSLLCKLLLYLTVASMSVTRARLYLVRQQPQRARSRFQRTSAKED